MAAAGLSIFSAPSRKSGRLVLPQTTFESCFSPAPTLLPGQIFTPGMSEAFSPSTASSPSTLSSNAALPASMRAPSVSTHERA